MFNSIGASRAAENFGKYNGFKNLSQNPIVKNIQKEQKDLFVKKQYDDIFSHEKAHKDAAGDLGGSIVIENNAEGIPVQGHVDIKMPVLNKQNPDKTIEHADTVIKSALAPKDPSGQDLKVAAEAKNIKSQAEAEKNSPLSDYSVGKNLNFMA